MRRVGWFLSRTAVPLLAASLLFLAGCENTLTDVSPEDIEPLYDLDCGATRESSCRLPPIEVCPEGGGVNAGVVKAEGCTGGGGDWPGDPSPPPGGGGDDGGGDGGGGGGGGGAGEWYPGRGFLDELVEHMPVDTVKRPSCPLEGKWKQPGWASLGHAWCNSKELNDTQRKAVETVLDRLEKLGPPCRLLAIKGRTLLKNGDIKAFTRSAFPTGVDRIGGVGFKNGVALSVSYLARLDTTMGQPGWEVNLQFALAHEIEHSLKGGGHETPPGAPPYYEETRNTKRCSGLS